MLREEPALAQGQRGCLAEMREPDQAPLVAATYQMALAPAPKQGQSQVPKWALPALAKGHLREGLPVLVGAHVGWILGVELRELARACCSERGLEWQPVVRRRALTCRCRNKQSEAENMLNAL